MKVVMASDHAGYPLKNHLVAFLQIQGYEIIDLGVTTDTVPSDYPDAATAVAQAIQNGDAKRGILSCGSGVGVSIAANKYAGVYAAVCHDTYSAHQGVEHDNMNVLVLGSRVIGEKVAEELADAFLAAAFTGEERHVRRIEKVKAIEAQNLE